MELQQLNEQISSFIKITRKEKKLTVQQLSELSHVSVDRIKQIESGNFKSSPSLQIINQLVVALNHDLILMCEPVTTVPASPAQP